MESLYWCEERLSYGMDTTIYRIRVVAMVPTILSHSNEHILVSFTA